MKDLLRVLKWGLLPIGLIHWLVLKLRHYCYDRGIFEIRELPQTVISVGNIQMGGTGKTPFVSFLITHLERKGYRCGLLSRGYGRKVKNIWVGQNSSGPGEVGDEPFMLQTRHPNLILGVDGNRYKAGRAVLENFAPDLFLLDDGFQHRALARQVDICLVDASRWSNHPFLFPFSMLRDLKGRLDKADIVVITKSTEVESKERIAGNINKFSSAPVFYGELVMQAMNDLRSGSQFAVEESAERVFGGLCGIAHPTHFFETAKKAGLHLEAFKTVSDHHHYTLEELTELKEGWIKKGISDWVITEKDAVKLKALLPADWASDLKIWVMRVEMELDDPEAFWSILYKQISTVAPSGY